MITVTINELNKAGRVFVSSHRTNDPDEAMTRAIAKQYGNRSSLYRDNGIKGGNGTHYGQIGYYVDKIAAATMVTGRVRIDVDGAPE